MKFVVTGAGQIGQEIVAQLNASGHEVCVLRRADRDVPGARTIQADAGDRNVLRREIDRAAAVFHCVHADYDPASWRRELPWREMAVMDEAAAAGIPVVFPESVYAFGKGAANLTEGQAPNPCSPLGEVRAELLDARAAHAATTISVVAGDLIGRGATTKGSVPTATVVRPVQKGNTAWVMGDPDVPHAITVLPDLARAMTSAAIEHRTLADGGNAVLNAPSPRAISMRDLARLVAAGASEPRVRAVPAWPLRLIGAISPTTRSLWHQRYLWNAPSALEPGVLTTHLGLAPTEWDAVAFDAA